MMNPDASSPPLPPVPQRYSIWLCVLGSLFMICWLMMGMVVGSLMWMASLMANDSGAASATSHLWFLAGVGLGSLLFMVAGIPGGLAFFMRGRRRMLLALFAGLLVLGAGCVGASLGVFF